MYAILESQKDLEVGMNNSVTLQDVLKLAEKLPLVDKVRLIERIAPQIQRELHVIPGHPRKSLRGLWRDLDITAEDIAQARQEMWNV